MDLSTFTPGSALVTVILLALAPFFAVMVTSFTKIVVVLSLLRNALGLQQVPPNVVLNGMALILTAYVMYPTLQQMSEAAGYSKPVVATMPGDDNVADSPLEDTEAIFATADKAKELQGWIAEHVKVPG